MKKKKKKKSEVYVESFSWEMTRQMVFFQSWNKTLTCQFRHSVVTQQHRPGLTSLLESLWTFSSIAATPCLCYNMPGSRDRAGVTAFRYVSSTSTELMVSFADMGGCWHVGHGPHACLHPPNPIQSNPVFQILWLEGETFSAKLFCRWARSTDSRGSAPWPLSFCVTALLHRDPWDGYLCPAGCQRESQAGEASSNSMQTHWAAHLLFSTCYLPQDHHSLPPSTTLPLLWPFTVT